MSVHITSSELKDTYAEADTWTKQWQKPFNEYERIAGNKLSKELGKNMPKVNDGSLAAALIETPMNVLPNMSTGKFTSTNKKTPWMGEIANIVWKTKIVPNANTSGTFFDKEQMALYKALIYGAQPRYNFFVSNENYTGPDFSLPSIRNVKLEPGKMSVDDSDYVFLDIYYTKLQLKKLIDQLKDSKDVASDGTWNVKALKKLADMAISSKDYEDLSANERDKAVNASGIKVTACFQRGKEAPFTMFSKHLTADELVREWKNPDPTGDLPITMQYAFEDGENPYGKGRIELAGPTQNLLDFTVQAYVLATQLGLDPARKLTGAMDTAVLSSIVNAPGALWRLGNAQIDIVQPTTSVYTQFPTTYGLYKSQLQNLQGRTDGSVSSESGNPQFSKTPAGVKQQEARTNSQDNYLRNKADTASAKMAEKMMNTYFAQMEGADILDIVEEDANRLYAAGYFDDNEVTPEPNVNEIPILFDELRDTFKFEYDARPETDEDEKNRWLELIDIYASNPELPRMLAEDGYKFSVGEAFKRIIGASGASDIDKVLIKLTPKDQLSMQQPEVDPTTGQPIAEQSMPTEAPQMPQQDPALQEIMAKYGVDEIKAETILNAMNDGVPEELVVEWLQGGVNE